MSGQAYSQAKVIGAMSAIVFDDASAEEKWLETKIPKDNNGDVVNEEDYWKGGDLDWPNGNFLFKHIYTDAGKEFGNSSQNGVLLTECIMWYLDLLQGRKPDLKEWKDSTGH